MALHILQPGIEPIGHFDLIDSYQSALLGGEVGTVFGVTRTNTSTEVAAYDARDGYDHVSNVHRVGVANSINASTARPLWLLDEGTLGYGTLFGQVIGTPAGLSTTGTNIGPHTAAGSGKVTCWDKPGIYAVSVDAVNTAADGLTLTSSITLSPGLEIRCLKSGKLTPVGSTGAVAVEVGRFLEFETSPYLVRTPNSLVGATEAAERMVFNFKVEA